MENTNKQINRYVSGQDGIAPLVVLLIVLGLVGVGGGAVYFRNKNKVSPMVSPTPIVSALPSSTPEAVVNSVKEFSMTSYYEMKDGKASTNFSLSQIDVKKGDTVRIKVTNTKGSHDFVIDEYGIKKVTPLNEEVTIEFTADKAGTFKYYCSMPGHRQMGQEGTLTVSE